jgi:hypothetical protein
VICAAPPIKVAVPTDALESRKVIVPVGVTVLPVAAATLAVNVTLAPAIICVEDAETEVFVFTFAGGETTTGSTVEVEPAKFESPE